MLTVTFNNTIYIHITSTGRLHYLLVTRSANNCQQWFRTAEGKVFNRVQYTEKKTTATEIKRGG